MEKKFDLIHLPDGMVVVGKENKSKEGLHICLDEIRSNSLPENKNNQVSVFVEKVGNCNGCVKIIAASPSLNLEGVPLLPPVEDNLKALGEQCVEELTKLNPKGGIREFIRMAVSYGYKAAQQRGRWSDEDVKKILFLALQREQSSPWDNTSESHEDYVNSKFKLYLQSLQKKPVVVVLEMEEIMEKEYYPNGDYKGVTTWKEVLKIVDNHVIVKQWIYEEKT